MPSASNKTENKAPPEANDPFKAAQSVVEKKVRNLEKRKGKLDAIREKRDQGEKLNADQQKAIDAYDAVLTSLEVTKDLQKQFNEIQTDLDKALKKQARKDKKERAEKRAADVRRIQDVLQLQSLLDCMGTDQVRSHFKAGKHNAKVLTEENFTQLDELYKLISPSRDENNFEEQLSTAAEHMYSYLEARDAEAAGSTYSALRTLVDEVSSCGYFEKYPYEEEPVVVEEPAAAPPPPVVEPEPEVKQEKVCEEPPQKVVEQHVEEPAQTVAEPVVQQAVQQVQQTVPHAAPDMASQQLMENADPTQFAEEDSFFSMPTFPPTDQRPFQEIVSSVQGTFNFLQESQIASDSTAPHHDPAVVAAKPMASFLHKSQTEQMRGTSFQGVSMLGNDDLTQQLAQSTQQQVSAASDRLGDSSGQQSASHDAAYTASQQDYIHTYGEHGSALGHTHSHTHSGMDQSVVMGTGMSAGQDMPHSIPLPNQSNIQDQGISHDSQGKKPFTMNPNAAMFQSMYNSSISHNQTNNTQMSQPMGNNSSSNNDKGMTQQNDYHSNGFGNNYRSGGPRGGLRGGGGRGGRGGMSNGYARNSNSRGGGGGAPYNSGRGGGFNSRGGGGRGGTYHGYPPRSDYHPEGGYQGPNNAYNGGSGYRRGGSGGAGSGSGPGDSGAGGMRGGPPRGGSGGGDRGDRGGRGPPRGGYNSRPPMNQTTA